MWQTKYFNTGKELNDWIDANMYKYQIHQIFVDNGYGVEYRPLKVIDIR